MKIIKQEKNYIIPDGYMLFDIETTGLSAQSSYVYLIGYMRNENGKCILTQLFCDTFSEEKELLIEFKKQLSDDICLIDYNGTTFDIPFLNHKFGRHALRFSINAEKSTDIYNELRKHKKYFELENLKQITVEKCAGFNRTDTFQGDELITLYTEYTGRERLASITGNKEVVEQVTALRQALLKHNSDDLEGLACIYEKSGFLKLSTYQDMKIDINEFELCILYDFPLFPVRFEFNDNNFYINNGKSSTEIVIPLRKETLCYFFPDYQNYTYIIDRGEAYHTSVCSGIDKSNKRKCKKNEAFIRKEGTFIPVSKNMLDYCEMNHIHLFKECYEDKQWYVEIVDNKAFLSNLVSSYFSLKE